MDYNAEMIAMYEERYLEPEDNDTYCEVCGTMTNGQGLCEDCYNNL